MQSSENDAHADTLNHKEGWVGVAFSFVLFAPSVPLASTTPMLLITLAADLILGTGLGVSVVQQAQYLPRPLGTCSHLSNFANTTSLSSNTSLVVFEVLAKSNGSTPQAQCESVVEQFRFAMAFMYVLFSIFSPLH